MTARLNVNIDHVATVRQARLATLPDPVAAALLAEASRALAAKAREDAARDAATFRTPGTTARE